MTDTIPLSIDCDQSLISGTPLDRPPLFDLISTLSVDHAKLPPDLNLQEKSFVFEEQARHSPRMQALHLWTHDSLAKSRRGYL